MHIAYYVSYFFGGIFIANAVPHFVSGVTGRPFQSPFAKPPGQGLSSALVNVLWGFFCFTVGFILIARVGSFDWHATADVVASAAGALGISVFAARHFGRLHGGDLATGTRTPP